MNRISAFLLFACCAVCFAQVPQIKSGSTVYIEPNHGYETYLEAAFVKKHVPLVVVADRDKAQYVIHSAARRSQPAAPSIVIHNSNTAIAGYGNSVNGQSHSGFPVAGTGSSVSASISLIDARTSQVLFAYSVEKDRMHQAQSTAEACAKHLKKFIEKTGKRKQ